MEETKASVGKQEFLEYVKREAIDLPDYEIVEAEKPSLYKEYFPWSEPPKMAFDSIVIHEEPPKEIWITDTTFRDGQQAREPYTIEQITKLYSYLHRLGGPKGKILHSEFFVYTSKDRQAIALCQELCREYGSPYPKMTGWIRATKEDLKLVKEIGLEETGMLASISDYHLFFKFAGLGRRKVIEGYLEVTEEALRSGIVPRVHLEDITRADVFGVVVPFVRRLMKLSDRYSLPVKVRYPDTLGVGLPWAASSLPRGIPKLTWVLRHVAGVPSEWLEFHGQNDFHLAVANATSAWIYGAALNNCTLLGIGERAGNVPLEAMVFLYAALKGGLDGMDTTVITEIGEYYKKGLGYHISPHYPLVGSNFNVTGSGIHADGLLKNLEMYLPFDTEFLLNSPPGARVTEYSGLGGIAFWINSFFRLTGEDRVTKEHPSVNKIGEEVSNEYRAGRVTSISNKEMVRLVQRHFPEIWEKHWDKARY